MLSVAEERLMLTLVFNRTDVNVSHTNTNRSMITDILSFTGIQRIIFIFAIVILFWILFIIIYLMSGLMIRLIRKYKKSSSSLSNTKVCQELIVSSDQHGSLRSLQTLHHPASCITSSNNNNNKQIQPNANYGTIHLTINHHSSLIDHYQCQQSSTTLLEYYLKTYNPLHIDLTSNRNEPMLTTVIPTEDISSETDTRPIENCSPLNCASKQRLHQSERYVRLKEQETSSAIADRLSECSTKLTSTVLPIVMITDCSNSQRLHTDIIEMNEDE